MRYNLRVPFEEKDWAEIIGAKWDSEARTWYVEDVSGLDGFWEWLPDNAAIDTSDLAPWQIRLLTLESRGWKYRRFHDNLKAHCKRYRTFNPNHLVSECLKLEESEQRKWAAMPLAVVNRKMRAIENKGRLAKLAELGCPEGCESD